MEHGSKILEFDSDGRSPFTEPDDIISHPNLQHPAYDIDLDSQEVYDVGYVNAAGLNEELENEFDLFD